MRLATGQLRACLRSWRGRSRVVRGHVLGRIHRDDRVPCASQAPFRAGCSIKLSRVCPVEDRVDLFGRRRRAGQREGFRNLVGCPGATDQDAVIVVHRRVAADGPVGNRLRVRWGVEEADRSWPDRPSSAPRGQARPSLASDSYRTSNLERPAGHASTGLEIWPEVEHVEHPVERLKPMDGFHRRAGRIERPKHHACASGPPPFGAPEIQARPTDREPNSAGILHF